MLLRALEGVALALAILALTFLWIRGFRLPRWARYSYQVSRSGIRIMVLGRILYHVIPARKIVGVRLQDSPRGYWNPSNPLKVTYLIDHRGASEGISVVCQRGSEVLLTPESPREFLRAAVESGFPEVAGPDWRDDPLTSV